MLKGCDFISLILSFIKVFPTSLFVFLFDEIYSTL